MRQTRQYKKNKTVVSVVPSQLFVTVNRAIFVQLQNMQIIMDDL